MTSVDVDRAAEAEVGYEREISISALLELELASGRRVVLLDDRGWSSSTSGSTDVWASTSLESITATARMVVGPPAGRSHPRLHRRNHRRAPRRSATLITVGALGGATWTFLVTSTGQAPAWLAGSAAAATTMSAAAAARHAQRPVGRRG